VLRRSLLGGTGLRPIFARYLRRRWARRVDRLGNGGAVGGLHGRNAVRAFRREGFAARRVFAAPKGDEVVREVRRVAGRDRTARIANVTPCPTFQGGPLRLVVVAMVGGHPLVEVAREIVNTESAHALRQRARSHALIEA